jgi:[acyl-carrier-protein] S-malonyltransferase
MMAVRTVFLLPGQGGYQPGCLAGQTAPGIAEVLRAADSAAAEFGRAAVSPLLTDRAAATAEELHVADPFALQLAVFAAALAGCTTAAERYAPDVLVGHSLGEIAALTAAGAFTPADGARLVCLRSLALLEQVPEAGGMIALDLPAGRAAHLVGLAAAPGLVVAVRNAPRQTVLSGSDEGLKTVLLLAEALGVRAVRLNAPYSFHSPRLAPAAGPFREAAAGIRPHPLRIAVHSPIAGRLLTDEDDLVSLLARQLTTPVGFLEAVRDLHAQGAEVFVECGRGGLSGLVRHTVPEVETVFATGTRADDAATPVPAPEPTAAPIATAAPAAQAEQRQVPDAARVLEELRDLYASTLGYPPEAIQADADLEADLGIDSLKRAEMMGKVTAHFGLAEGVNVGRFLVQPTLGDLVDLVVDALENVS